MLLIRTIKKTSLLANLSEQKIIDVKHNFIFSNYKDEIVDKIRSIVGLNGGYYDKYLDYKMRYLRLKEQV